ncbi:hypothetical protein barba126A_phanotate41 [Rheinheimera phage vB_RspM_barba_12-6A]|jgi:hypothetical protein|nr:hypothetical protein barba13A_phanotate153 [Rheinheimera phage vB_RspM_barba_1-3A]QNO01660.1 hypothetical protein barba108A_phanotate149 [Rheinheimera phage vB_RspM_barba_10-8A]QNO01787.1 hypothetical protein barba108B_phanotate116 [Rheinheimera phage vB_RspM_barba_10-8B]QNO01981.1 hypothetical protein barba108D_phanotate150 [Rheinheimera phage vB_RspM_barba_10-8D]QNO02149.1 hypothetical protein barba109A_phanotate157 [Rheinheimera phage vB_RspM_barba_10-9A]QNO02315.1 hypothetical protein b
MSMFCKHKWEILSELKTDSIYDRVRRDGGSLSSSSVYGMKEIMGCRLIQLCTCTKCGKIKKFVEHI